MPTEIYLGTIPVDARLPWDHIDIGLEDGFLAKEYRKAVKGRLSPPCGKPFGKLLHPTNVEEHGATSPKLVCYDCGVACDLTKMREERLVFLRKLGAEKPPEPRVREARPVDVPRVEFTQGEGIRYRLRFTKLRRVAYIGHLDMTRHLMRIFRRAGLETIYTEGFHPKAQMVFGPALGLGLASLGELVDVKLAAEIDPDELCRKLTAASPDGLEFTGARRVPVGEPGLAKRVAEAEYAAVLPGLSFDDARGKLEAMLARGEIPVVRASQRGKTFDLHKYLRAIAVTDPGELAQLLEWPAAPILRFRVATTAEGSAKPAEVVAALLGEVPESVRMARVRLYSADGGDPLLAIQLPVVAHAGA